MTLEQMRILVKVVQAGNFTRAAALLGVRKSHVSRVIAGLEAELGVRLIDRSTRAQRLTDVGAQVYGRALVIAEAMEETHQAAQEARGEPSGTLRLTAGPEFGQIAVTAWIARYLARYAAMRVDVDFTARVVDLVHEGIDLAIRIGEMTESRLIARKLGEIDYGLFACPRYLASAGDVTDLPELGQRRLISFSGGRHSDTWVLSRQGQSHEIEVDARLRCNNSFAVREALLASLGIGRLPLMLAAEPVAEGRLVPVLGAWSLPPAPVFAVYPENRYLSPKVRAFIDLALEAFPEQAEGSRRTIARGRVATRPET